MPFVFNISTVRLLFLVETMCELFFFYFLFFNPQVGEIESDWLRELFGVSLGSLSGVHYGFSHFTVDMQTP